MDNLNKDNEIDDSVFGQKVIRRGEPQIYAFFTPNVPNAWKIGDTQRPVDKRLKEWGDDYDDIEKKYTQSALLDNGYYFRDYSVHKRLKDKRLREDDFRNLRKKDLTPVPYSKEFFKGVSSDDIKQAIKDIKDAYENGIGVYKFHTEDGAKYSPKFQRVNNMNLRENQREVVDNFLEARGKHHNLLMYAVMRFGKTRTSMACAQEMGAKSVIVVSGKADVKDEWRYAVQAFKELEGYAFLTKEDLETDPSILKIILGKGLEINGEECKRFVLFLTLQDLQGSEIKECHQNVFKMRFDLMLVDETHFGARAKEYGRVLKERYNLSESQIKKELEDVEISDESTEHNFKRIRAAVKIHLSGTPYNILLSNEFKQDDIIAKIQYSDIYDAKLKWIKDNNIIDGYEQKESEDEFYEWENPYFGFPQMLRFAFNPNEGAQKKLKELNKQGTSTSLSMLFRPNSIRKKENLHMTFEHEQIILELFMAIDGSEKDKNILSFLDNDAVKREKLFQHMVCVLPFRASCDALEELLTKNKDKFHNLDKYEIINISGYNAKYKEIQDIKAWLKAEACENKKTLSLTVGKMLTGSTVEQWDSMLYFKDTASAQEYDQAIFRLQSPYIEEIEERRFVDDPEIEENAAPLKTITIDKKPQTVLVDFDLERVFKFEWQRSFYFQSKTQSNMDLFKQYFDKSKDVSPLLVLNNNKLDLVEEKQILDFISGYTGKNSIVEESQRIEFDENLMKNKQICRELEKFSSISHFSSITTSANDDGSSTTDIDTDVNNEQNLLQKPRKKVDAKERSLRKYFSNYCTLVLLFAFLTEERVRSINDIISIIKSNEKDRKIAKHLRIKRTILSLIGRNMSSQAKESLEHSIYTINSLNYDGEDDDNRVSIALNKFNRVSDSEVAIPEKILADLTGMIPEIQKNDRILDFASLNGAISTELVKKYGPEIRKNIFAIPTSDLAYELTKKVYRILGIPLENILDFKSLDITNNNKKLINKISSLQINIAIGFPPLRKQTKGGAKNDNGMDIYQKFFRNLKKIDCVKIISMATKATWYTCTQSKDLMNFRKELMVGQNLRKLHDYPNVAKLYQKTGVTLRGGISLFLFDKDYEGECSVSNIVDEKPPKIIECIDVKRDLKAEYEKYDGYFIRWNKGISILDKVLDKQKNAKGFAFIYEGEKTFDNDNLPLICHRNPFHLEKEEDGSFKGVCSSEGESDDCKIKVWLPNKNSIYIDRLPALNNTKGRGKYIPEGKRDKVLKEWKVLIAKSSTCGDEIPRNVISSPIPCGANNITATTHYLIRGVKSNPEADNLAAYMKTRFFRFMVNLLKTTQNMTPQTYKFAPRLDFSKKWTDDELYDHFKISGSEQKYIEGLIKEKPAAPDTETDGDEDQS
jgi:hypothetical protein